MRDYRPHDPDEPWWAVLGASPSTAREQRAYRLSQFARDVAGGPQLMMSERKLAYRRAVLEGWAHYLEMGALARDCGSIDAGGPSIDSRLSTET